MVVGPVVFSGQDGHPHQERPTRACRPRHPATSSLAAKARHASLPKLRSGSSATSRRTTRYSGYLADDFAEGIAAIRELITAGYRPSVAAGVYSPEDARQHFVDFYHGKNVVITSAPRAPKGIADATAEAIEEIFVCRPTSASNPRLRVRLCLENLNWGQDKIDAERGRDARDRPSRLHHRGIHRPGQGSAVCSTPSWAGSLPASSREPVRPEHARRCTAQPFYQIRTNLVLVHDYEIKCSLFTEINKSRVCNNYVVHPSLSIVL